MRTKLQTFPLTYFTPKSIEEFDSILLTLKLFLSKDYKKEDRLANAIANIFVEKFDINHLNYEYNVVVSDRLEKSIKQTLKYAIDTEMLIRYIYDKIHEFEIEL